MNPCTFCRATQTDSAALCHLCTDELGRLLRGARQVAEELCAIPEGRGSVALDRFAAVIYSWSRSLLLLNDEWHHPDRPDTASWLVAQLPTIRRYDFASTMLENMLVATSQAISVVP